MAVDVPQLAVMDPITFEVLRSEYTWMCSQGSALLRRVAHSPIITEGNDLGMALLTRDGRLVAHGIKDHTPYLATFEPTVQALLEDTENLQLGDVYIFNDPYRAGTHAQDVRLIRPVFIDDDLFAFVVAACHWADIGGPVPGTFNPRATESYAEGLHLPVMLLYREDQAVKSTFELISLNVRMPHDRFGDLMAQYQAVRLVERRLMECVRKHGRDTIELSFEELFGYSRKLFEQEIKVLPDGVFEFADYIDKGEYSHSELPVRVCCRLEIEGCNVTIDWSDSDPAPTSPIGLTRPALLAASFDGTLRCFPNLVPLNHGIISAVSIKSKPNTVTHVTRPTPVSGHCSGAYEKACSAVMGAWAQPLISRDPTRVFAGTVNLQNCVVAGMDAKSKSPFPLYLWLEGGQGARSFKDGPSFVMAMYAAGASNQSCEVQERRYPVRWTRVEAVPDSCGDGKFRGGFGVCRSLRVLTSGKVSVHGDREQFTPYGLGGGTNGGPNRVVLNEGEPAGQDLGVFAADVPLKDGDELSLYSNGGGGYGDPLERDPKLVLEDVLDGLISLEKAKRVYGVVIRNIDFETSHYEIDWDATARLRRELSKTRRKQGYGPWEIHPYGLNVR